jgi:hypothetical protein
MKYFLMIEHYILKIPWRKKRREEKEEERVVYYPM